MSIKFDLQQLGLVNPYVLNPSMPAFFYFIPSAVKFRREAPTSKFCTDFNKHLSRCLYCCSLCEACSKTCRLTVVVKVSCNVLAEQKYAKVFAAATGKRQKAQRFTGTLSAPATLSSRALLASHTPAAFTGVCACCSFIKKRLPFREVPGSIQPRNLFETWH